MAPYSGVPSAKKPLIPGVECRLDTVILFCCGENGVLRLLWLIIWLCSSGIVTIMIRLPSFIVRMRAAINGSAMEELTIWKRGKHGQLLSGYCGSLLMWLIAWLVDWLYNHLTQSSNQWIFLPLYAFNCNLDYFPLLSIYYFIRVKYRKKPEAMKLNNSSVFLLVQGNVLLFG